MKQLFIDYSLLVAFTITTIGIITQTVRIIKTKNVESISLIEVSLRLVVVTIFFVKYLTMNDIHLIIGQIILSAVFLWYFITLIVIKVKKK